ncbi:hypothetical protein LIN78_00115 [Leeia sp. TBRC 13508]|uniref:Uncharacterized protein n=1 Tax=Leeia speluncae TaxID=2884804 RepID=A0ABS8D190_9NEIS|nr:hypothetical protein [Leeia speluncae]MCB6181959.1 hypothetical protein [Leeia speluncae]
MEQNELLDIVTTRLPAHCHQELDFDLDKYGRLGCWFYKCFITTSFEPIAKADGSGLVGVSARLDIRLLNGIGIPYKSFVSMLRSEVAQIKLDYIGRLLHTINHVMSEYAHLPLHLPVIPSQETLLKRRHEADFLGLIKSLNMPLDQYVIEIPILSNTQQRLASIATRRYKKQGLQVAVMIKHRFRADDAGWGNVKPDIVKYRLSFMERKPEWVNVLNEWANRYLIPVYLRVNNLPVGFPFVDTRIDAIQTPDHLAGQML